MKGVILGICPRAQIVDITHECRVYDVSEAAFTVSQACRYFPPKTVHVVVVDPGVGTLRRPILVEAAGQCFVGPDNGVFAFILSEQKHKVRAIANTKYFLQPVSQTFHGRDVFAPVAAHLAKGVPPARFGKLVADYLLPRSLKPERTARRGWTGCVLKVDRFGNLITNYLAADFPRALEGPTGKPLRGVRPRRGVHDCRQLRLFRDLGRSGIGGENPRSRGRSAARSHDFLASTYRCRALRSSP